MNYEKKYKEALEKASKLRVQNPFDTVGQMVEHIFPELKESEDEKSKKYILEYLYDGLRKSDEQFKDHFKTAIAWIEKQVPIDEEKVLIGARKDVALSIMNFLDKNTLGMCLSNMECADLEDAVVDSDWSKVYDYMKKKLEKQGEQKQTDEVEPKFHEGEWVVYDGWTTRILKVTHDGYVNNKQGFIPKEREDCMRLWDITKDAEDGDVLFQDLMDGKTFIYSGVNPNKAILYSFIISNDGKDVLSYHIGKPNTGIGNIEENKNIIHPATKEQRDLLFQKMQEAGYEWDAETLELKKIEQKSQRMVSAEAKEALYDKPTDEEMKELLRTEYEKGRADTIAEMKSSWSKEDEVKINRIVACLENLNVADNDILLKDVDWLKSLKDRVQPKQEWSIEDEKVIAIINNALTESNTLPDDYDKVYDWLEYLRQRIRG